MALFLCQEGFEYQNATVQRTVAREGLTERIHNFRKAEKQTNPSCSAIKKSHPKGWLFFYVNRKEISDLSPLPALYLATLHTQSRLCIRTTGLTFGSITELALYQMLASMAFMK